MCFVAMESGFSGILRTDCLRQGWLVGLVFEMTPPGQAGRGGQQPM
jgi:hypothetical protein